MSNNTVNIPEADRTAKNDVKYSNIDAWLGIPYAKAERFKSPVVLPFDESLTYDKTGPASLQASNPKWVNADKGFSEDCLNLNIWSPKERNQLLPVVVYFHGGGFVFGSNSQTTSVTSGLAASGRVVGVSVNYRLGALGWLSLSQYGGEFEQATNLGLQDMIASLKWIKENISKFGGDPNQITLIGHSGGSFMSGALLAVPSAKGLFNRIILFSGGTTRIIPQWWAEQYADRVIEKLGFQDDISKLMTVDANLLNQIAREIVPQDKGEQTSVDNTVLGVVGDSNLPNGLLVGTPSQAIANGECSDIDIIFSNTTNEFDWWVANDPNFDLGSYENIIKHFARVNRLPITRVRKIVEFYQQNRSPIETRAAMFTDYVFTLPYTRDAKEHAKQGGRAFLLSIGAADGSPAVHGTEMYGIVGQKEPKASLEQQERDEAVTNIVLDFTCGDYDKLWSPIGEKLVVKELGQRPYHAESYYQQIELLFEGILRI